MEPSQVRLLLTTAAMGAVAASLVYLLYRWSYSRKKRRCSLTELKMRLEQLALTADEAVEDMKDGISQGIETWLTDVKDALMSRDMQEALATVSYLIENVKKFDMEAKSYNGYAFLLLALVKKAHDISESSTSEGVSERNEPICQEQLERAKRFGQFAINVYPASWRGSLETIGKSLGVPEDDIVYVSFTDRPGEGHCPRFALFLDHDTRSLVLAIRGTFSLKDVVLDILCEDVPFLSGHAHSGILEGARRILERCGHMITASLMLNPGYSLILTGHSLGAGSAELITMELLLGPAREILPPNTLVQCVALAPPPVFRPGEKDIGEEVKDAIEIYINNSDIVPRLSLASMAQLLACVRAVDCLKLSPYKQFSLLSSEDTSDLESVVTAVDEARQDMFPYLQHPGRIYYLKTARPGEKIRQVLKQESSYFASRIFLLDNMVLDHLQPKYEEALSNMEV